MTLAKLTRTTYPDRTFEESGYDAAGRLQTRTDRAGRVTAYVYDAAGQQTAVLFPDHTSTTNIYDDAGQLTASIDARGYSTTYGYDATGRRTGTTNALGQWTWNNYDGAENLTSMTTLSGGTTYQYDAVNRRTNTTFADGTFQVTVYDDLGRRVAEIDQAGVTTGFQYDGLGRLTAVTNAFNAANATATDQTITYYQYDERGNLRYITNANSQLTSFEYDTFGRRTKRTLPGGNFESFSYYDDNVGNLWKHTDFNGKTTVLEYDSNGRVMKKTPDSSFQAPAIQFTYTATGQRETMSDASGLTKYEYLDNGRLWKKAAPNGTLTYTYDENGNVRSVHSSTQNGLSLNYEWDEINRLSKVIDNGTGGTTQYKYDGYGRLQEMDYPTSTGVKHIYGYDELDRLASVTVSQGGSTRGSFAYALGPTGNRTQLTENLNGAQRTVNYGYDNLYRLTNETIAGAAPAGSITYDSQVGYSDSSGFDPVGNRRSRGSSVSAVPAASYSYDSRDRLNSDSYDNNGNTAYSGNYYYGYDFENRLIWRNAGAGPRVAQPTFDLGYDGDGNRIAKTNGTTITLYLVDEQNPTGYPQVVEESQSVNGGAFSLTKVYVYGMKLISQTTVGAAVQYYGFDGHGSVRLLLNADGTIAQTYTYDAFGILLSPTAAPAGNDYLYAGEQFDRDLGLYYLRARYYSPTTGRFWTMDSYEGNQQDSLSLHKYLYAHVDPVNNRDPSGREVEAAIVTTAGIGSLAQFQLGAISAAAAKVVDRRPRIVIWITQENPAFDYEAFANALIPILNQRARFTVSIKRGPMPPHYTPGKHTDYGVRPVYFIRARSTTKAEAPFPNDVNAVADSFQGGNATGWSDRRHGEAVVWGDIIRIGKLGLDEPDYKKLTAYALAHEVLHALGARDLDNVNEVMNNYVTFHWLDQEPVVGAQTLDEVDDFLNLPPIQH